MNLIESLSGSGEVFENESSLGKVNYRINIYQEIIGNVEGLKQKTGSISSDLAMRYKLFDANNLHLVLEDGRNIRFFLTNDNGEARFTGDFF